VVFVIVKVIQEEGLYVYNIQKIVEKHFNISIASVRSRGESLLKNKDIYSSYYIFNSKIIRNRFSLAKTCF
jgi:hypothetical protein